MASSRERKGESVHLFDEGSDSHMYHDFTETQRPDSYKAQPNIIKSGYN